MAIFFLPSLVASIGQSAQAVSKAATAITEPPPPTGAIKTGLLKTFGFLLPLVPTLTLVHISKASWQAVAVDLPALFTREGRWCGLAGGGARAAGLRVGGWLCKAAKPSHPQRWVSLPCLVSWQQWAQPPFAAPTRQPHWALAWVPPPPPAGRQAAARSRTFVAGCKYFVAIVVALWLVLILERTVPVLEVTLPFWQVPPPFAHSICPSGKCLPALARSLSQWVLCCNQIQRSMRCRGPS